VIVQGRSGHDMAGINTGMRVLDMGCGCGEVAFLAADLVGTTGELIGVDRASAAVNWATARAKEIGNVKFLEGDPTLLRFDRPFDAVVPGNPYVLPGPGRRRPQSGGAST
jgi:ubiquinone/menaquinone biosynthesis C-methylase UbiE